MNHQRVLATLAALALAFYGPEVVAQSLSADLKAEGAEALAIAARERGDAVNGAVLFPQQGLACANCHVPGDKDAIGPDLTAPEKDVSDLHVVDSILSPSKTIKKGYESVTVVTTSGKTHTGRIVRKDADSINLHDGSPPYQRITLQLDDVVETFPNPKSSMPDNLIDQLKDRQQFLDLVRYVMEIRGTGRQQTTEKTPDSMGREHFDDQITGLALMDSFSCCACHRRDVPVSPLPPKQAPNLSWGAGKIDPRYIERFIAHPRLVKPGTTMPDVMSSLNDHQRRDAARELTHYIVSLSDARFERQPIDHESANRGGELFHSVGCVACHSPRSNALQITDGAGRLPDKSKAMGRLEEKFNLAGLVSFLEDPHAARPSGRMPNMKLTHWEAIDIANYLLMPGAAVDSPVNFELNKTLADKGREQFTRLGCNECHVNDGAQSKRQYPRLGELRLDKGCLSNKVGKWPAYDLTATQRNAMIAALKREPNVLDHRQKIALTLATLNCIACHERDRVGGVSSERDQYFHTTNPNLGPQGRIPPTLTGVGAKLRPKWMRQVLVSGRQIRPYLKTRMPQYGTENVAHLVELFRHVDTLAPVEFFDAKDQKEIRKAGHELAGSAGLNCIACHNFQRKPASTMPAVDLTEMAERLEKNWFYHYMRNPQWFNAGTVMPSFWPGGRAIRTDILSGDTDQQIAALWNYLLDGRQARVPRGLRREPIELLAINEAVMLRRSYPGIGKRGIGVGYPGQVNLAFDAEQMRIAMIWKGKFADPSGVWRSQGHGRVRPLGTRRIEFSPGPEIDDARHAWEVDDGRPPRHRFKGYHLDELQRPSFLYQFDSIDIEDFPVDKINELTGQSSLQRTLTLSSGQRRDDVVFRVATAQTVSAERDGTFLIGETLRIKVDPPHSAEIVKTNSGQQLRIPLTIANGKTTLVLHYTW